jgi:hypothetical protein
MEDDTPSALRAQMSMGTAISETTSLSPMLQYHLSVLDLMCDCAAGATNIVEARIQSVLDVDSVLKVMVDETVPMDVRIRFIRLFYEAMIEVQVPLPGLSRHPLMWVWLSTFPQVLKDASRWLKRWHKTLRQKVQAAQEAKFHAEAVKMEKTKAPAVKRKNSIRAGVGGRIRSPSLSGRSPAADLTSGRASPKPTAQLNLPASPTDDGNGGVGEAIFSPVETKQCRLSIMYTFESVLPSMLHFFTLYYNVLDHANSPYKMEYLQEELGTGGVGHTLLTHDSPLRKQIFQMSQRRGWAKDTHELMYNIHSQCLALREACLATERLPESVSGVRLPFFELSGAAVDALDDFVTDFKKTPTMLAKMARTTMSHGLGRIDSQISLLQDSHKQGGNAGPGAHVRALPAQMSTVGRTSIRDNQMDKARDTQKRSSSVGGGRKFSLMLEAIGEGASMDHKGALLKRCFRANVVALFEDDDADEGDEEQKSPLKEYAMKDMEDIVEVSLTAPIATIGPDLYRY